MKTPLKVQNVTAIPVLLYGSECWTLTKQQINEQI